MFSTETALGEDNGTFKEIAATGYKFRGIFSFTRLLEIQIK